MIRNNQYKKTVKNTILFFFRFVSKLLPNIPYLRILGNPIVVAKLKNLNFQTIFEAAVIENSKPKTIHRFVSNIFVSERRLPESYVFFLKNGVSNRNGMNFTNSGKLVLEPSYERYLNCFYPDWNMNVKLENYRILSELKLFPIIRKYNCVVATLTSSKQSNYYHWLFEILPRFYLIEKVGIKPEKIYIENKTNFQKQTLKLMGYERDHIIDCSQYNFISSYKLIAPSVPGIPGIATDWACKFLREKFNYLTINRTKSNNNFKRIYISREDASKRRVINEKEVVHLLKRYDFHIIRPGELDFLEQVDLFKSAEIIVAPHGAGLSNIVFCNEGTKILEIFSPFYVNPCYWYITQEVGLEYSYFIGNGDSEKVKGPGMYDKGKKTIEDIRVDLERLRKAIDLSCSI